MKNKIVWILVIGFIVFVWINANIDGNKENDVSISSEVEQAMKEGWMKGCQVTEKLTNYCNCVYNYGKEKLGVKGFVNILFDLKKDENNVEANLFFDEASDVCSDSI